MCVMALGGRRAGPVARVRRGGGAAARRRRRRPGRRGGLRAVAVVRPAAGRRGGGADRAPGPGRPGGGHDGDLPPRSLRRHRAGVPSRRRPGRAGHRGGGAGGGGGGRRWPVPAGVRPAGVWGGVPRGDHRRHAARPLLPDPAGAVPGAAQAAGADQRLDLAGGDAAVLPSRRDGPGTDEARSTTAPTACWAGSGCCRRSRRSCCWSWWRRRCGSGGTRPSWPPPGCCTWPS